MTCQQCANNFQLRRKGTVNKFCSRTCYWLSMKGKPARNKGASYPHLKGKNNNQWKDTLSYTGIHRWLYREYGKADLCENSICENRSKRFEWALITGKEYKKERNNFMKLCAVCHHAYDRIAEKRWGRG